MKTGEKFKFNVCLLMAAFKVCTGISYSSKKSSSISSSISANYSINSLYFSSTKFLYLVGISVISIYSPLSPLQYIAFFSIKSIHPSKEESKPIGIYTAATFILSFFLKDSIPTHGLAPYLSNLLTKTILGTLYLLIYLNTVNV